MTSRSTQKQAARERREAAEAAALAAASRKRRLQFVAGGFGGLGLAAAVAAVVLTSGGGGVPERPLAKIPAQQVTDLKTAAKLAGGKFTSYDYKYGISDHVTTRVDYRQNPPTNGPHFPVPAADGNYANRTTPPTEQLVHSLEHGRIEIQYRKGLPQAQIDQLVALYNEDPRHVLLFENETNMDCDIAVTAWAHGLLCSSLKPTTFDAIRTFRDKYRDQGPEYVA